MAPKGNALLRALPHDEFVRLQPRLQRVTFSAGERVVTVGEPLTHVWFFETGAASRLVQLPTGQTVEAGIVGSDGVAGLPLALGGRTGVGQCLMQIEGSALALSAADLEEHARQPGNVLLKGLTMYAHLYIAVLSQLTACHCLHRIDQRLCRILLTLQDHAGSTRLRITHDTLADFLGVHRPSVTYALQAIATGGAIVLDRRRIEIADRQALAATSCECYDVIRKTTDRELVKIRSTLAR